MLHVNQVSYAGGHRLALVFSDGTLGVADLAQEVSSFKPFAPLRDQAVFAKAFIADGTVCWLGELDMAPERLYALAHGLPAPDTFDQAQENEHEMSLRELRKSLGVSQQSLADAMDMTQSEVSRLEQRSDHRLSTIRRAVQAFGGQVEVVAIVGEKRVRLAI